MSPTNNYDALVVGAGFTGLYTVYKLRELGLKVCGVEAGDGVGGTWYWNRYPGASCDIESYVYLPLLEKTGFVPKQKYTDAPETLEYCRVLANKFGLDEIALMQTEVI